MKYFLCVEFEQQGLPLTYKAGDAITFVSMTGLLKCGIINDVKFNKLSNVVPAEYHVDCGDTELIIAIPDYILKKNAKVLSVSSHLKEVNRFPLRT